MYKIESEQDGGSGKGPNFKLIVMLFAASIVAILLIALLFLSEYGRHVRQHIYSPHPTSQLARRSQTVSS